MANAGSVGKALQHAAAGVDCVVIQGSDAGGHTHPSASAFAMLPEARDALDAAGFSEVLLAYAGGVCDGRGVAAALALGADAVVLGTRLAAAAESDYTAAQRAALGAAADGAVSTTLGTFHDWINGNHPHSSGLPGRCLVTRTTALEEDWTALKDVTAGGGDGDDLIRGMAARGLARAGGDGLEWGTTWAGAAVGLVPSGPVSLSAGDIVRAVMAEAAATLTRSARLLYVG
jgi:nitronate monooxygenase